MVRIALANLSTAGVVTESAIVRHLKPVAVVWSDAIPDDVLQFKKVRFGWILNLFADASRRGREAARPSWRPLYDKVSSVTCGAFWS